LRFDDTVIAETGTVSMGLASAQLPRGVRFHNQTLWGAIGWATPATLGAAVAAPNRRRVLFKGEGSQQLTAQEIGQFHRLGLKPIRIVLNNSGYLVERMLCSDPNIAYNDLARWNQTELPHALRHRLALPLSRRRRPGQGRCLINYRASSAALAAMRSTASRNPWSTGPVTATIAAAARSAGSPEAIGRHCP
jgi:hypothetical protein